MTTQAPVNLGVALCVLASCVVHVVAVGEGEFEARFVWQSGDFVSVQLEEQGVFLLTLKSGAPPNTTVMHASPMTDDAGAGVGTVKTTVATHYRVNLTQVRVAVREVSSVDDVTHVAPVDAPVVEFSVFAKGVSS